MRRFFLLLLILVSPLSYSQVTNQDILNRLDEIEDEKLFSRLLKDIRGNSTSATDWLKSDPNWLYMGADRNLDYFINNKKSYKDKEYGFYFFSLLITSNQEQKSKLGFSYKSVFMWVVPACGKPTMLARDVNFYSEQNAQGQEVYRVPEMRFVESTMNEKPILKKIQGYVCN